MKKEEEKLLFADICARTPYNVLVRNIKLNFDGYVMSPSRYQPLSVLTYDLSGGEDQGFSPIEDIRPYLRPMSNMTEEEKKELCDKYNVCSDKILNTLTLREHSKGCWDEDTECSFVDYLWFIDWLNAHHFDYRGLIEKGLALEAQEGMYKI